MRAELWRVPFGYLLSLIAGPASVTAPTPLVVLSQQRTHPRLFQASRAELHLVIDRVDQGLRAPIPLNSPFSPWGEVQLDGDTLYAHIPENVYAAEAVLRAAYQVVCHRAGGVLLHGCAFHWNGSAVVAVGASGDGKSTLSRLSRQHPGHATLLTDEIVWLEPSLTVYGTPFRSDEDNEGSPGPAKLKALLLLAKGSEERLDPVPAAEALPLILAQLYSPIVPVVPRGELVRRVMTIVDALPVQRLTFRKHSDVGPFLKAAIGA